MGELTSVSKKLGQSAVVYYYFTLSQFFCNRCYHFSKLCFLIVIFLQLGPLIIQISSYSLKSEKKK